MNILKMRRLIVTYTEIRSHYLKQHKDIANITAEVTRLIKVVKGLVLKARYEAAEYYDVDPLGLTQSQIQDFVLKHREYDPIEIGWIVTDWRKHV